MTKNQAEILCNKFKQAMIDLGLDELYNGVNAKCYTLAPIEYCVEIHYDEYTASLYSTRGLFKEAVRLERRRVRSE